MEITLIDYRFEDQDIDYLVWKAFVRIPLGPAFKYYTISWELDESNTPMKESDFKDQIKFLADDPYRE